MGTWSSIVLEILEGPSDLELSTKGLGNWCVYHWFLPFIGWDLPLVTLSLAFSCWSVLGQSKPRKALRPRRERYMCSTQKLIVCPRTAAMETERGLWGYNLRYEQHLLWAGMQGSLVYKYWYGKYALFYFSHRDTCNLTDMLASKNLSSFPPFSLPLIAFLSLLYATWMATIISSICLGF